MKFTETARVSWIAETMTPAASIFSTFIRAENMVREDPLRILDKSTFQDWTIQPHARQMWSSLMGIGSSTETSARILSFITESWTQLFPDTQIVLFQKANLVDLIFKKMDGLVFTPEQTSYHMQSQGVRQVIGILGLIGHHLLNIFKSKTDANFILLDAPGLYLHPTMMKSLFNILEKLNLDFGVQVVVTSHSADLMHSVLAGRNPNTAIISTDAEKPVNLVIAKLSETLKKVNKYFDPHLVWPLLLNA